MTKIFLIGMPGSGKTTLGKELAVKLGVNFLDLDEEIENTVGKTINRIFEEEGEDHFRKSESKTLKELIERKDHFIMATGGGAACFFDNMNEMKKAGTTIYLNVSGSELFKRLKLQVSRRPLLKDKTENDLMKEINEKIESRRKYYESADIVLKGDNISAEEIVFAIGKETRQ